MVFFRISIILIICMHTCSSHDAHTGHYQEDTQPFQNSLILEGNQSLPVHSIEDKLNRFYSRYYCSSKPKCHSPLCFTAKEILVMVQLNSSSDVITREEFSNFSLVLLYHLQNISNGCQSPGSSFINYQTKMLYLLTDDSKKISKIKIDTVLRRLLNLGHHDNNDNDDNHDVKNDNDDGHGKDDHDDGHGKDDHGKDDGKDDHGKDDHGKDDGHGKDDHGKDDHDKDDHGKDDHGKDDHGKDDHGKDDHGKDDGHGKDDHGKDDHDKDDHGKDDHGKDDHGKDDHGKDDGHGKDDHGKDDHDDDHGVKDDHDAHGDHPEDHDILPLVFKKECFSTDVILEQAAVLKDEGNISDNITSISEIIVSHLFSASTFHDTCRLLPKKSAFINYIFSNFGSKTHLSINDFKKIIKLLGLGKENQQTEEHDHRHSKRSVQPIKNVTNCFDYKELLAVFNIHNNASVLWQENFIDLCPALLQQFVSGACKKMVIQNHLGKPSMSEQYGYGILSVAIICLCSILGVFIVICQKDKIFVYTMTLFEGLAVGTLASDALLHLIPEALGVHSHEGSEADDSSEPHHLWFSLATFGGAYFFYLLEVCFATVTKEDEHTHNLPKMLKSDDVYTVTSEKNQTPENPISNVEPTIKKKPKYSSLSLIILLGDALHNFADGLTIGAAFSSSKTMGLMTSIAVLCHEIPHELGDFAVLLANGMSLKRAVLFNFLSSLTAFWGLFVGLAISADFIIRRWIFAISAGMFLYIAFVDLLPIMKRHKVVKTLMSLFANIGLVMGVLIMALLGLFENELVSH